MQEFLAVFLHTVAYHDAALAHHMSETGFIPELYAIPWCVSVVLACHALRCA